MVKTFYFRKLEEEHVIYRRHESYVYKHCVQVVLRRDGIELQTTILRDVMLLRLRYGILRHRTGRIFSASIIVQLDVRVLLEFLNCINSSRYSRFRSFHRPKVNKTKFKALKILYKIGLDTFSRRIDSSEDREPKVRAS